MRREDVDLLTARLRAQGIRVRDVHAEPCPQAGPILRGARTASTRLLRRLNGGLIAVAAAALLAAATLPILRMSEARGQLEAQIAVLRAEAVTARRELDAAAATDAERAAFAEAIFGGPTLVETLRAVTVALPDDTWLSEMNVDGARVVLIGETGGSAADLVLGLGRARALTGPRLAGAVSRTASGAERFVIEATR